jgi:hypothetical protein
MADNDKSIGTRLRDVLGKVRPQIFVAMIILGLVAWVAILYKFNEIASSCVLGITLLGREIISSDAS